MPSSTKPRSPSTIRSEISDAYLSRDITRLERLFLEGARHDAQRQEFLRPLARLYQERSLATEALAAWRQSFDHAPSLEAAYHLLRHDAVDSAFGIEAYVARRHGPSALAAIERLIERGVTLPSPDMRHLAICGMSYCGSSMLGRLLDGFDGFHDVAESHWLIDRKPGPEGRRDIDFFADPSTEAMFHCRQCGVDCPVFSPSFRLELQLDRAHWYFRIAERLQTQVLVSSDKNFRKYATLDPLLRFDAIVLFKSPLHAWQSFRKRRKALDRDEDMRELERFIGRWNREYENGLKMRPSGDKLVLSFDRLVAAPEPTLRALLAALDMAPQTVDFDATTKGRHSIGGNDLFVSATRRAGRIDVRAPDRLDLPRRHIDLITDNVLGSELFSELQARSDERFGKP